MYVTIKFLMGEFGLINALGEKINSMPGNTNDPNLKNQSEAILYSEEGNFRIDYLSVDFKNLNELSTFLEFLKRHNLGFYKKKFHTDLEQFEITPKVINYGCFYLREHKCKNKLIYTVYFPGVFSGNVLLAL